MTLDMNGSMKVCKIQFLSVNKYLDENLDLVSLCYEN